MELEIAKQLCEGRTTCIIVAENSFFGSTLKCPKSGGQFRMSYSCGKSGIKENIFCHVKPSQAKAEIIKNFKDKTDTKRFQRTYECNTIDVKIDVELEYQKVLVDVGSSLIDVNTSVNLTGGSTDCPRKCYNDSKQIYDGNLIQEIQTFGASFQVEFKVLIRKFNGLVFNILSDRNTVVLSVTAKKNKLRVAFEINNRIKFFDIEHLKKNIWYHLEIAQKQSLEMMYQVIDIFSIHKIGPKICNIGNFSTFLKLDWVRSKLPYLTRCTYQIFTMVSEFMHPSQ